MPLTQTLGVTQLKSRVALPLVCHKKDKVLKVFYLQDHGTY